LQGTRPHVWGPEWVGLNVATLYIKVTRWPIRALGGTATSIMSPTAICHPFISWSPLTHISYEHGSSKFIQDIDIHLQNSKVS
jgi:hypothetical protein